MSEFEKELDEFKKEFPFKDRLQLEEMNDIYEMSTSTVDNILNAYFYGYMKGKRSVKYEGV